VIPGVTVSNGTITLSIPGNSVITLQSDAVAAQVPEPAAVGVVMAAGALALRRNRKTA